MTNRRTTRLNLFLLFFVSVVFCNNSAFSQEVVEKTSAKQRAESYEKHKQLTENSVFKNLPWQFIGPSNVSGRMTDVEVVTPKGENYTIYVAGASGGIWKTKNEGITWIPVFEHGMSTAFGDLALDPQNQNVIWAGTGEANIFRSSNAGAGIYRSKDAGKIWEHLGLTNTNTIARILVHPENSDVVYVAAGGNEWTNDKERGIYKTEDGGRSWNKILYVDEKTGAYDLIIHPENPEIMYATTWQRIRKKWNDPRNEDDYTGSNIFKTSDGGKNWKKINSGLPDGKFRGRIGIDLCKSSPNTLYAFIDNYEKLPNETGEDQSDAYGRPSSGRIKGATVYRSDNGGEDWRQVSEKNTYMEGLSGTYGWVFGQMRVDPVNPDKIFVLGLYLNVSEDGGKTFRTLDGMHMDHHGLWIDPKNTDYIVNVNDGGVAISYDGENFRTFYDNLPLVQFFNINVDMAEPFHVYGSVQDHGSYRGVVDLSRGRNNIQPVEFESAPGGEGSNHFIDPNNPDKVYSAGFYGTISKTNMKTGQSKNIMPPTPDGVDKLRGQWLAPFILSPHNPGIIYHGTQFVHRSMNEGETWERISPDLTYNDADKKGDIPYQTIFTISESPLKFGLIYAGTDDGRVWVTQNSGTEWQEINKKLPFRKWVSQMEASRFAEGRVYMSQNGKRDDDFAAYIWKSEDYGQNWEDITGNIPCGPVNVIREDPVNENILYVGTDYGVYISLNRGESWSSLPGNLPTTYVHDLVIHPREDYAVIGTHGRGAWAMDIRFIREVAEIDPQTAGKILTIEDCRLPVRPGRWFRRTAKDLYASFYLRSEGKYSVEIIGENGSIEKSFDFNADKGLNFFSWDLMLNEDEMIEPGKYKLKITGSDFSGEKEFSITQAQWRR
ncbi:WD40/YVTN/BNR-like repeat-containing protein [Maribellus maritimus]|uniref:WD40/YVTN/BNR-like repeat-containing protein n=1 Tax=Maribellus maritimus TaxID=2870838 RepID=UPI001EECA91E|nr:hypothetical protein [Maribellus maritimus]MCG6187805.1 hypothetical protein [Maribellus maritimus]